MSELELGDLDELELAGETEEEESDNEQVANAAEKPTAGKISALGLRRKALENKQNPDEIYPSWDPVGQGKGAKVVGKLLEKRTQETEYGEQPLLVIDTQTAVTARDRDGEYDDHVGPVTVWCSNIILKRHWAGAEEGKITYIEFLGVKKSQSGKGRRYNDYLFSQED